MTQDNANVCDDTTKLMMDEYGGIHVVGFGENSLVAVAARDKETPWKRAHPKLVDQIIYRFNSAPRQESTHPTQDNTGGDAATPAMTHADIEAMVDKYIFSSKLATEAYNKGYRQAELAAHALGAAWMREQVICAVNNYETTHLGFEVSTRLAPDTYWVTGQARAYWCIKQAIRAIPLPTNADLLAEAMKLPEVAALVDAISDAIDANPTELNLGNYDHDDVCRLQNEAIDVWQILSAALAPFTAAKETP